MSLQKLICSQCGSNELQLFGSNAYKCESCGTILKEEKPKETSLPSPIQKPKEKPFRSKRIQHALEGENEFNGDFSDNHHEAGNQFVKMIFWMGVIGGLAVLCGWLLF